MSEETKIEPVIIPAPPARATDAARQRQRFALLPPGITDATLTPAEAERRAALLRQAQGRRGE